MNIRTPVTMLILLGVLLGAAFYGWKTIISPATGGTPQTAITPSTHTTRPAKCTVRVLFHKGEKIKAKKVRVNVYNAGNITGLASDTLNALASNKFRPGIADNAPSGVTASNVSIITDPKIGATPPDKLVAKQFKGKVIFYPGADLGPGVDVIVGNSFVGVNPNAKHHMKVRKSLKECVPGSKHGHHAGRHHHHRGHHHRHRHHH